MKHPPSLLREESVIDRVEVLDTGAVQVRRADRVMKNDRILAETFHRHTLLPGDDLSAEEPLVRRIALAAWRTE